MSCFYLSIDLLFITELKFVWLCIIKFLRVSITDQPCFGLGFFWLEPSYSFRTIEFVSPASGLDPLSWHLQFFILWALFWVLSKKFSLEVFTIWFSSLCFVSNFFSHSFWFVLTTFLLLSWSKQILLMNKLYLVSKIYWFFSYPFLSF